MRPLEFVTLAHRLGRSQDEANLRAAASLAYYGAFHFAGEKLEQLTAGLSDPFVWTGLPKNHHRLRNRWADRSGSAGDLIANFLFFAHELRKKADYDLHLTFTLEDKEEAFRFVARALRAVRQVR